MANNLYGLCIVKNEADIIDFSLGHASRFCKAIFVLDNGSEDDTWERVVALSRGNTRIVPFEKKACQYGVGLRGYIFNRVRSQFKPGDWLLILDSDEFLESNPHASIAICEQRGFELLFTFQAQFYITGQDLMQPWCQQGFDRVDGFDKLPVFYQINWSEPRLFKYKPTLKWRDLDDSGQPTQIAYPPGLGLRAPFKIVNRHYQYRSRPQMKKRLALRALVHAQTGRFKHNQDQNFHKYIRNHRRLKRWVAGISIVPTHLDFLRLFLIKRSRKFRRFINERTVEKR